VCDLVLRMDAQARTPHPDQAVAAIAARQHGVVSVAQLRAAGLGRGAIELRVRRGRLHPCHRGVYMVGHPRLSRMGEWMAAALACGEGALLSHASTLELFGVILLGTGPAHVTVAAGAHSHKRAAITVHRSRNLPAEIRTMRRGIPSTNVARALIDVAPGSPRRRLERLIDEADRLRLCSESELREAVAAHPGHRGASRVARALAHHDVGSTLTRLELEERFLEMCRAGGLPQPLVNERLEGYIVDFLWPQARLVAETDGWDTHRTRRAFEEDRRRDARLAVLGYLVVRFTWRQVVTEPKVVAGQIRTLLRSRGPVP
jgi:hypothetical protein